MIGVWVDLLWFVVGFGVRVGLLVGRLGVCVRVEKGEFEILVDRVGRSLGRDWVFGDVLGLVWVRGGGWKFVIGEFTGY